jgi:uncharacterized protein YndB with AHSA1/START domain
VKRVVLEPFVGGRIFEEHGDGRRFQWGEILDWDPPKRLKFTFHAGRSPDSAQEVEIRFVPLGSGTRVELVATKWEQWGPGAARVVSWLRGGTAGEISRAGGEISSASPAPQQPLAS